MIRTRLFALAVPLFAIPAMAAPLDSSGNPLLNGRYGSTTTRTPPSGTQKLRAPASRQGFAGLYQINVLVPDGIGPGDVYIEIATDTTDVNQAMIPVAKN